MRASLQQKSMNRIGFGDQSNFLKRRDSGPNAVGRLDAFQIKLLNLAQISKLNKKTIIPYYLQITRYHLTQDFYGIHRKNR